jgi:hypothetical protein
VALEEMSAVVERHKFIGRRSRLSAANYSGGDWPQ